jgi:Carboxypeptidase regulatory-like domain
MNESAHVHHARGLSLVGLCLALVFGAGWRSARPAASASTGTLSGTVVDESDDPIPDCGVRASPYLGGWGQSADGLTNASGYYELTLEAASYTVRAACPGYALQYYTQSGVPITATTPIRSWSTRARLPPA